MHRDYRPLKNQWLFATWQRPKESRLFPLVYGDNVSAKRLRSGVNLKGRLDAFLPDVSPLTNCLLLLLRCPPLMDASNVLLHHIFADVI